MRFFTFETASKVIGYINAIISIIFVFIFLIFAFMAPRFTDSVLNSYVKLVEVDPNDQEKIQEYRQFIEKAWWAIDIGLMIVFTILFVFSLLLLIGIYKKKPGYILSYYVFGVVCNVIYLIMFLVTASKGSGVFPGLLRIATSTLMLVVVWFTYKKIKMETEGQINTNEMSGVVVSMPPPSYPYVAGNDTKTVF